LKPPANPLANPFDAGPGTHHALVDLQACFHPAPPQWP
jgi:hypothetical protein